MRKITLSLLVAVAAAVMINTMPLALAQSPRTPIPLVTLVPPTLVPPPPTATPPGPLTQSAIAQIKNRVDPSVDKRPVLIVGIPYNLNRFAVLKDTGEVEGFEAEI